MASWQVEAKFRGIEQRLDLIDKRLARAEVLHKTKMRDIFDADEWDKATSEANGAWFYGTPIRDMDRDELLFVVGKQIEGLQRHGAWA